MTFGSLFSGIGGIDLGLERSGMTCKWQVEIDEYATRVLEKHWPDVRRWDDVTTFPPPAWVECDCCENSICTWHGCHAHDCDETKCPELEDWCLRGISPYEDAHPGWTVDLIAAGFPCTDISYVGKGGGIEGERSGLFFEAIRVVRQLRPRYVLLENVAALLTRGLDRVHGELATLGYSAESHCIPASSVGAPHIRDRVFILGHVADPLGTRPQEWKGPKTQWPHPAATRSDWWTTEPNVGRVANGVPERVDRLKCLGNAVVPQVAEYIANCIGDEKV